MRLSDFPFGNWKRSWFACRQLDKVKVKVCSWDSVPSLLLGDLSSDLLNDLMLVSDFNQLREETVFFN